MNTKIVDHLVEDQVKDHNTQKGDLMKMMKQIIDKDTEEEFDQEMTRKIGMKKIDLEVGRGNRKTDRRGQETTTDLVMKYALEMKLDQEML